MTANGVTFLTASMMTNILDGNVSTNIANTYADPKLSYIWSCVLSWPLYVVAISKLEPDGIIFATFMLLAGGFLPMQALMGVPWAIAVRIYPRIRVPGWLYFPAIGVVEITTLGCTTAILVPKLPSVEDQTFLETIMFTLQRNGVSLPVAGLIFGLTYWSLGVRHRSQGETHHRSQSELKPDTESQLTKTYAGPLSSYVGSSILSWIVYVVGFSKVELSGLSYGSSMIMAGLFVLKQGLTALPWALAIYIYRRSRVPGWIYFPAVGAAIVFTLACVIQKLLTVEAKTFLEATIITLQRQGIGLLVTGGVFGLTYWFLGIRARS